MRFQLMWGQITKDCFLFPSETDYSTVYIVRTQNVSKSCPGLVIDSDVPIWFDLFKVYWCIKTDQISYVWNKT